MNERELDRVIELLSGVLSETAKVELFRQEVRNHIEDRRHPLRVMLRRELQSFGYWQNKPRGDPSKGFKKGWGKHKHTIGGES